MVGVGFGVRVDCGVTDANRGVVLMEVAAAVMGTGVQLVRDNNRISIHRELEMSLDWGE